MKAGRLFGPAEARDSSGFAVAAPAPPAFARLDAAPRQGGIVSLPRLANQRLSWIATIGTVRERVPGVIGDEIYRINGSAALSQP